SYYDENDEQSVELQRLLQEKSLTEVVEQVTGLTDHDLIAEIVASI
ncbi:MAG: mannitol-1-phosphate 5-dehydrogenase, partial [Streptococcus suis]